VRDEREELRVRHAEKPSTEYAESGVAGITASAMQHVVVQLSVNAKDEVALATYEEFVKRCREREVYEQIELKIITPDLLSVEKSATDPREILMAKALDKLIHTKKSDKSKVKKEESHLPKVFLLCNYPSTEEEAFALMDPRFKYPVLDSVIQIVNKTESTLVRCILLSFSSSSFCSSEGGPPTTVPRQPEDQPGLLSDDTDEPQTTKKKHLLSEVDLEHFFDKHHSKHFGHITYDEINAVRQTGDKKNPWSRREFENLFEEFSVLTSALAESKHVFREWAAQTFFVDVKHDPKAAKRIAAAAAPRSGDGNVWKSEPLYSSYLDQINLIPAELQGPVGVMHSMIRALAPEDFETPMGAFFADPSSLSPKSFSTKDPRLFSGAESPGLAESPSENQPLSDLLCEPAVAAVPEPILVIEDGDRSALRAILARRHTLSSDPSQSSERPETNGGSPRVASPVNDLRPVLPLAARKSCLDLIGFEATTIFHSQVPRLVGQTALPLRPNYNRIERSVMESELLTFTELSAADVHRFHLLQTAENMVERILPKLPNFTGQKISEMLEEISITKRHHFRHIPAATLSQQLACDIQSDPVILREYYPLTDQLLLAYIWIPPHRRLHQKEWKLSSLMRVKPTYEEFRILREKENYTPRTVSGLKHTINITAAELEKHNFHKTVITPSDNSLVSLNASSRSSGDPWLSISIKKTMIGMRVPEKSGSASEVGERSESHDEHPSHPSPSGNGIFFCHSEDDVRITAAIETIPLDKLRKPDGKSFVRTTLTDMGGLTVAVNTDGLVTITPPDLHSTVATRSPFGTEKSRMVLTGGVVCRILDSEYMYSRDIMMPDGSRIIVRGAGLASDIDKKKKKPVRKSSSRVQGTATTPKKMSTGGDLSESKELVLSALIRDAPEEWSYLHLSPDGSVTFYQQASDTEPSQRLPFDRVKNLCKSYLDGESKSEVMEYRDGRLVINYANDDLREVRHPDGTRFVTQLAKQTVFIEKINSRYPTVETDLAIDRLCRQHSRGIQVPIAMGGDRVRTRVAMSDGTAVLVKYNTRVTARYNGSLRVVKRTRDSLLLEDGGVVTYFPASSWSAQVRQFDPTPLTPSPLLFRRTRKSFWRSVRTRLSLAMRRTKPNPTRILQVGPREAPESLASLFHQRRA
jgi:hypothetical protein